MALYDSPLTSQARLRSGALPPLNVTPPSPYAQSAGMGSGQLTTGFIGGSTNTETGNFMAGTREGIKQGNRPTPFALPGVPALPATPNNPGTPATPAQPSTPAQPAPATPTPWAPVSGAQVQPGDPSSHPGFIQVTDPTGMNPARWGEMAMTPAPAAPPQPTSRLGMV